MLAAAVPASSFDVHAEWFVVADIFGELLVLEVLEFWLAGVHHPN